MTGSDRIGLIGVGLMGHGIARNILQHGFPLTYLRHPGNQPDADLMALGATAVDELGAVPANSDVILLCVTGSAEVEGIVLGDNGLQEQLEPKHIVIDCSTIQPQSAHRVAASLAARGVRYLDAPMTRTPREAEAGRLNLMVGGDADLLEQTRPILQSFAENIYHAGPTGAGHTLKLLHNYVSLGNCALLAEAVVCARRSGVDENVFIDVLASGGGGSTALGRLSPYILEGDQGGFLFSIANCRKDLSYYAGMADELKLTSIVAHAVGELFTLAEDMGAGAQPLPHLIDLLQQLGRNDNASEPT